MLIVQVRPFADAIYNSKIFPISDCVKVSGENPNYDILQFIIDEANKRNIEIHAWINPYRISSSTELTDLVNSSVIAEFISTNKASIVEGKGIYFNPTSQTTKELIISGVKELIENYKINGVHFDDYFYPDYDIDLQNYDEYIKKGGSLSIEEYRYNTVLDLIKNVYSAIKEIDKNIEFGISPEGNIENNYNKHFLNVEELLKNEGYVDYIMPQLYFGFENDSKPFIETLNEWCGLIKVDSIKFIPALSFYKVGIYDKYAKDGSNEWIENNDIISRQIIESRKINNYVGFSLFRYDFLFNENKFNKNTYNELNYLIKVLD